MSRLIDYHNLSTIINKSWGLWIFSTNSLENAKKYGVVYHATYMEEPFDKCPLYVAGPHEDINIGVGTTLRVRLRKRGIE